MNRSVLIVGHRPQIADRLFRLGVPYAVWHDKRINPATLPGCLKAVEQEPFSENPNTVRKKLARMFPVEARFTHVVAGTEASVVAASIARRAFSSRRTSDLLVRRCHDKRLMKKFLQSHGIPVVSFVDGSHPQIVPEQVIETLGLPVVIKAPNLSGRQGMAIATSVDEFSQLLATSTEPNLFSGGEDDSTRKSKPSRRSARRNLLFETFIDAQEVSVESWISQKQILFSNITEYVDKTWVNLVPSRHSSVVHEQLVALHKKVIERMNIDWGLAHAEYFIKDEQIYFGEIALRPPGGYLMDLISLAYGFDAWNAFVENELELKPEFHHQPDRFAAAVLFHPGAGKLERIEGTAEVKRDPNLQTLRFLRKPGTLLEPRVRVSNAAGYAIFSNPNADSTLASVESARKTIRFEMSWPARKFDVVQHLAPDIP